MFVCYISFSGEENKKYIMARNRDCFKLNNPVLYKLIFIFKFAYIMLKVSDYKM